MDNFKVLNNEECLEINGGNPILYFIAGAIAGGVVYDVVKPIAIAASKAWNSGVQRYPTGDLVTDWY